MPVSPFNKIMTIAQRQRQRNEHVRDLRERGVCIKCEREPVGTNMDGTVSVRCVNCRPKRYSQVRPKVETPRYKLNRDGEIEAVEYFDTPEFQLLCKVVHAAIPHKGSVTVSGIIRDLTERGLFERDAIERRIQDVIAWLIAGGDVSPSWSILPTRYERATRKQTPLREWNGGGKKQGIVINPSNGPKMPDDMPQRKVLA